MKKYFILSVFVSLLALLPFGQSAKAESAMTLSQFVELVISLGVVPADKVDSARAFAAGFGSDSSLAAISTSTSYLQVLSPNGGESWDIDSDVPYTLSWGSTGLKQVRLALIGSKSGTCELNALPYSSKDGNNNVSLLLKNAQCYDQKTGTTTPLRDGSYKLRVYYTDIFGLTMKDESNAAFKINPVPAPSLKVTYPNGGENLIKGKSYTVKYSLKDITASYDGLVYLSLIDSVGNVVFNSHKLLSKGTYSLDIPASTSAGAYKVKLDLTTTDREEVSDTSDSFFWISSDL